MKKPKDPLAGVLKRGEMVRAKIIKDGDKLMLGFGQVCGILIEKGLTYAQAMAFFLTPHIGISGEVCPFEALILGDVEGAVRAAHQQRGVNDHLAQKRQDRQHRSIIAFRPPFK